MADFTYRLEKLLNAGVDSLIEEIIRKYLLGGIIFNDNTTTIDR